MIQEFAAAVQSAKVLTDLLKATHELRNANEFIAAVSEINSKLMEANVVALSSQEKQAVLTKRISDLEQQIMKLEDWKRESERYQLTMLAVDVPVFTLKPGKENGEPPHKLCANCYSKRQKGYLQQTDFDRLGALHHRLRGCGIPCGRRGRRAGCCGGAGCCGRGGFVATGRAASHQQQRQRRHESNSSH